MTTASGCYAGRTSVSDQELLHHLSLMPFIDAGALALVLGEARADDASDLQWSVPTAFSEASAMDLPPFPATLFLVDTEEVAETCVNTASRMPAMLLPIPVSSREGSVR